MKLRTYNLFRKELAKRVAAQDPTLAWNRAWAEVDKHVLAASQSRLKTVLDVAGIDDTRCQFCGKPSY